MSENQVKQALYDLVIIGGGPAGLTAGIYGGRSGLKTVIIEQGIPGGQAAQTEKIENYPGFPEGIDGPELSLKMYEQATKFGTEFVNAAVESVELEASPKVIRAYGETYLGRAVIVATGAKPRRLNVPGEEEYSGRGVSYCATCDGAFFKGEDLVVVGGGDSAVEEALFLTHLAKSVTIIHRRDELRAQKVLRDRALTNPKINFVWNSVVDKIDGDEKGVRRCLIRNIVNGEKGEVPCGGAFIYVGTAPATEFLPSIVARSQERYLVTNENLETSVEGVFAAGDCRAKPVRQVANAVGEGAVAAIMAEKYLAR